MRDDDLIFSTKGLHICNLNVHHLPPKTDEVRLIMANENGPDIFGFCETFMNQSVLDSQVAIDGFDFCRKDRAETQDKSGGGIILYFRNTLTCKRRPDLEISKIETIWMEIELPNSKPVLICSAYRPPSEKCNWVDLFEEELSIADMMGLELIYGRLQH